jgi:CheY-like chemotaxis protein
MTETTLLRIGLLGGGVSLLETCTAALRNIAVVGDFGVDPATGEVVDATRLDLLLFPLQPPHDLSLERLVALRQRYPDTPIVILGRDVRTDLAVELVKSGFDDFLALPLDYLGLCRKVLRATGQYHGPAFGWSLLAPVQQLVPVPAEGNRRRCFRASVDPKHPISAHVELAGAKRPVAVVNLSIATDGWPGGLLLAVDPITAKRFPFQRWELGEELTLSLDLGDGQRRVEVVCLMVTGLREGEGGFIQFAVQYWVQRPRQEAQLRKYWVNAQRSLRADSGGSRRG